MMSNEMIAGLSTLITALVSALAAAVVLVLNARSMAKQRTSLEKANEYEKIITRYEKDIQRREAHDDQVGVVVDKLKESNARLRERYANLQGRYDLLYDYTRRQYSFMQKQGITPEVPPVKVDSPTDAQVGGSSDDISFAVRQVEQESKILKATRPQPPNLPAKDSSEPAPQTHDEVAGLPKRPPAHTEAPAPEGGES
jgi:hypothetical protein